MRTVPPSVAVSTSVWLPVVVPAGTTSLVRADPDASDVTVPTGVPSSSVTVRVAFAEKPERRRVAWLPALSRVGEIRTSPRVTGTGFTTSVAEAEARSAAVTVTVCGPVDVPTGTASANVAEPAASVVTEPTAAPSRVMAKVRFGYQPASRT